MAEPAGAEGPQVERQERRRQTQRAAVVGAVVNLLLSVVKIGLGWMAHSQALIADGIHSLSDLMSDALVWWAAHHASHGPDPEHPYGHGRFETAATLALGALLVLVAGGILWDALDRLLESSRQWRPGVLALYGALFSILVNEALYWYTLVVARRIDSAMLRANAWHHRSDAISSVVVLVGVGGALLGITWMDVVAAGIVGLMVARIGWDLGWGALRELVDSSLEEEQVVQIREQIHGVHGVRSIHMLRTRRQGHEAMADVHVQVEPWLSVSEGHMIALAVEEQIKRGVPSITDVTVHIDPENDEEAPTCRGLPLRDEVLGRLRALWGDEACLEDTRRVLLHYLGGRIDVELFFPLDCYRGVDQAHALKRRLQARLDATPPFGELKIYYG